MKCTKTISKVEQYFDIDHFQLIRTPVWSKFKRHRHTDIFPQTLKAESQNFLDPVLAKPESLYKARF